MNDTAVATRQTDPNQSLEMILNNAMPELQRIAPKYVNITRMVALAIEAKMRNELLAKCSPVSVLNFCKKCAEAGTDRVGSGGMWAVPFFNKKTNTYEMTPMPDWRLIIEKAKKAKAILHATSDAVYENDEFSYERGMNPRLFHVPAMRDRGKPVAVYCVYTLPDGGKDFTVMDIKEDVDPIRKRSKAADAGPWVTDYVEMAKKTVVKRALKIFEGASPELTALIETDNSAIGYANTTVARPPVAMPKVIESTATETAKHDPSPAAEPESESKVDGNTVAGRIAKISKKEGSGKKGAWVKVGILIGKEWYGTFDGPMGKTAEKLEGQHVVITFKEDGKYKTITSIEEQKPVAAAQEQTPNEATEQPPDHTEDGPVDPDDDNLPFGQTPKATVESVKAMEDKLDAKVVAKAKKALGMASDVSLSDLPQEFLENLAKLYRSVK